MNEIALINRMIEYINAKTSKSIRIMEVCGSHTQAIEKHGIRGLLSPNIRLISGPGCPVCVTDEGYIDAAIDLLKKEEVIIATFGDMVRVTGSKNNLQDQWHYRNKIRVIYSPIDAVSIAEENRDKIIVMLAIGFETTAPIFATTIMIVRSKAIKNLLFLTSLKIMPPPLKKILDQNNSLDGIICPGHVATIKGEYYFRFIPEHYRIPAVICGFEPLDIVGGIYYLVKMMNDVGRPEILNLYKRCVKANGNEKANKIIEDVFDIADGYWRGIGNIEASAYVLKDKYKDLNAVKFFNLSIDAVKEEKSMCSEVILGERLPSECIFFGSECSPEHPKGPLMVSSEGSCNAQYRYRRS